MLQFKTTLALKDLMEKIAISMKRKEILVYKLAILKFLRSIGPELHIKAGIAYMDIKEKKISLILISQSAKKAPSPDKINFWILYMI